MSTTLSFRKFAIAATAVCAMLAVNAASAADKPLTDYQETEIHELLAAIDSTAPVSAVRAPAGKTYNNYEDNQIHEMLDAINSDASVTTASRPTVRQRQYASRSHSTEGREWWAAGQGND